MGELQGTLFPLDFNRSIGIEARRQRITSEAGAVLLRELLHRSGLSQLIAEHLIELRDESRVIHPLSELVLTRLLLDAQGYSTQLAATLLRDDPVLRLAVSTRGGVSPLRPEREDEPAGLASQPTLSRMLDMLATEENLVGLDELLYGSSERLAPARSRRPKERTLDMDSLPIEVHGAQPGSAMNGHFHCRCYHPLVLRSEEGFYLGAWLREGNAHTAEGALDFALPYLKRERQRVRRLWLRIDAGFPSGAFLEALEAEDILYVARLKSNQALARRAAPFLEAYGGEGIEFHELEYQAGRWSHARRLVLVVLPRADRQGELFIEHFFLITNATQPQASAAALLERYRGRGNAEKDFGDWKNALSVRLSSTPRPKSRYRARRLPEPEELPDSFSANEARLLLSLLAANLLEGAMLLLARRTKRTWSREHFRRYVLSVGGRVLIHSRRVILAIDAARAPLWNLLWEELVQRYPARGSPPARALPTPA
jgi:hypothetical protein